MSIIYSVPSRILFGNILPSELVVFLILGPRHIYGRHNNGTSLQNSLLSSLVGSDCTLGFWESNGGGERGAHRSPPGHALSWILRQAPEGVCRSLLSNCQVCERRIQPVTGQQVLWGVVLDGVCRLTPLLPHPLGHPGHPGVALSVRAESAVHLSPGFPSLRASDIWGQIMVYCEGCTVL